MDDEMQQVRKTEVADTATGRTDSRVEKVTTATGRPVAIQIVYFIGGALLVLLAMRFVLSLLGANQGNAFADLIYSVSRPFVAPFFGLFNYQMKYGVSRLEFETLVAIAVYAIVIYGIARIVQMATQKTT